MSTVADTRADDDTFTFGTAEERPDPAPRQEAEPIVMTGHEQRETADDQTDRDLHLPLRNSEAATAKSIAAAVTEEFGLSPRGTELLTALLILSVTDLSRGTPWAWHMTAADWFQGFLFDDVNGWLTGAESTMSMRAFRTAMSGDECMRAFNGLHALIAIEGTRDEVFEAVGTLLIEPDRTEAVLEAAGL